MIDRQKNALKSWRSMLAVVALLLGVAILARPTAGRPLFGAPGLGQGAAGYAPPAQVKGTSSVQGPIVLQSLKADTSPPLSSMTPLHGRVRSGEHEDNENPNVVRRPSPPNTVDTAIQKAFGPLVMPAPILNFDGEYNEYGPVPPTSVSRSRPRPTPSGAGIAMTSSPTPPALRITPT